MFFFPPKLIGLSPIELTDDFGHSLKGSLAELGVSHFVDGLHQPGP